MIQIWTKFVAWLTGRRDDVQQVLDSAGGLIQSALPIVEWLESLKAELTESKNRSAFVAGALFASDVPPADGAKLAARVGGMPVGEILLAVAVFVLSKRVPASVPERMIRLAVEMAYCVYKMRKTTQVDSRPS